MDAWLAPRRLARTRTSVGPLPLASDLWTDCRVPASQSRSFRVLPGMNPLGTFECTILGSEMNGEPLKVSLTPNVSWRVPSEARLARSRAAIVSGLRCARARAKPAGSPPRCRVHCSDSSPNPGCTAKSEAPPKPSKAKSPAVWLAFLSSPAKS
jgi:hypothetical protein